MTRPGVGLALALARVRGMTPSDHVEIVAVPDQQVVIVRRLSDGEIGEVDRRNLWAMTRKARQVLAGEAIGAPAPAGVK